MNQRLKNAVAAIVICLMAPVGDSAGQTVVPGPWGQIVDGEKPLTFTSEKARVTYFRRNQMRAISGHFRSIEAVVMYGAPFAGNLRHDVEALARHGEALATFFPTGTELDDGKFGAKPEIWRQPEKFARHVAGFRAAVAGLTRSIADKGDLAQSLSGVRHECLACHQSYRVYAPAIKP